MNRMNRLRMRGWALLLAALPMFASSSEADPAARLREIRPSITVAEVVLIPERTTYIARLGEADVHRYGCAISVRDQDKVAALLDLLSRSAIRSAEDDGRVNDLRISISLTSKDGDQIKLFFAGIPRLNGLVHGTMDGENVIVSKDFPGALRTWAIGQNHKAGPNKALPCKN